MTGSKSQEYYTDLLARIKQANKNDGIKVTLNPTNYKLTLTKFTTNLFDCRWFINKTDGIMTLGNLIFINGYLTPIPVSMALELEKIGNELAVMAKLTCG